MTGTRNPVHFTWADGDVRVIRRPGPPAMQGKAADHDEPETDTEPLPDTPALEKRAQALTDEADSWANQLTAAWVRLLRREKKVITEKLKGSKARTNTKFWDWGDEGPPDGFEFKALDVGKWLDKDRWLDELEEDLTPIFNRMYETLIGRGQKLFDGEPEEKHLPGRHDQDRHGGGGTALLDRPDSPWDRLQKLAVPNPADAPSPRYWLNTDGMWVPVAWHEDAFPRRTSEVGQPGLYRAFADETNAVRVTMTGRYEASVNIFNPMNAAQIEALSTLRRSSVLIAPEGPDTGGKIRRVQSTDPESMRAALEWANGMLRGRVRHPSRLAEFKHLPGRHDQDRHGGGVALLTKPEPKGKRTVEDWLRDNNRPDLLHFREMAEADLANEEKLDPRDIGDMPLSSYWVRQVLPSAVPNPADAPSPRYWLTATGKWAPVAWHETATESRNYFEFAQATQAVRISMFGGELAIEPMVPMSSDQMEALSAVRRQTVRIAAASSPTNGYVVKLDSPDPDTLVRSLEAANRVLRGKTVQPSRLAQFKADGDLESKAPRPRARILRERRDLAKLTARRITEAREYHEAWLTRLATLIDDIAARDSAILQDVLDGVETQYGSVEGEVGAVAMSQAVASVNEAQLEVVKRSGLRGKKVWFTAMDERVRPTHRKVHGQRRELDKPFKVPHRASVSDGWKNVSMQYPGDRSAPPGLWINCRCVLLFYPAASSAAPEPETALEAASRWASLQSSLSLDIASWLEHKALLRRVRTTAGARRYNRPIGSPIYGADATPEVDPTRHARSAADIAQSDPRFHVRDAMKDWVYSFESAKWIRMAAGELTNAYDDVLSPQLYEDPDNFFERETFAAYGPPPKDMMPDDDDIAEGLAWGYANAETHARALLTALTKAPPHDGPLFRHVNVPLDMLPAFDEALRKGHVDLPLEAVGDQAWFVARFDRSSAPEDPEFVNPLRHDPEGEMQSYYYDAAAESPSGMPSWQTYLDEQDEERRQREFHVPVLFQIEPGARALTGGTEFTDNPRNGVPSWREYITGGRFEVVSDTTETLPSRYSPGHPMYDEPRDRVRVVTLRQTHTYLPSGTLMKKGLRGRFRETLHPRDRRGQFTDKPGSGGVLPSKPDLDLTDRPIVRIARLLPPIRDFSAWGERGKRIKQIADTVAPLPSDSDTNTFTMDTVATLHAIYGFDDPITGLSTRPAAQIDVLASGRFRVHGQIVDAQGNEAGAFDSIVDLNRSTGDPPFAFHGLVQLWDKHQGQGFGERFLRHEEDHYIALGVQHIDLLAGLNVGGYAWARSGFDWHHSPGAMRDPWFRVRRRMEEMLDGDTNDEEKALLRDLLPRFDGNDPPTPAEIAMLGLPGVQGQRHLGKRILQGTEWEARKTLVPSLVMAAMPAAQLARARRLAALADEWYRECEARDWDLGEDGLDWNPGADADEAKALSDDLEDKKKGPKKVRTPEGRKKYGQEIGTVITPDTPDAPDAPDPNNPPLGSRGNPHVTSSAKQAAAHLARGEHVELPRPKHAVTLIKELRKIAKEAEAKGEDAPVFDLCKVTVEDTSLFCVRSKGIPRIKMPQLTGFPTPGSRANGLPRDAKGKVDLAPHFLKHLAKHGATVEHDRELASRMLPSQSELDGAKVGRMMRRIRRGEQVREIFISHDNYIVDGHHHWAATVGLSVEDAQSMYMRVARVDMGILELLDLANDFAQEWGIEGRGVGAEGEGKELTIRTVGYTEVMGDAEKETKVRRVRTEGGREQYDQEIGEIILPDLPALNRPWRIVSVVDTRNWEEGPDDRWHATPGSGSARECDRCGRMHEVHVTAETDDAKQYVVGVGCARVGHPEMDGRLKAHTSAAVTLARLERQLEKREAERAQWYKAKAEVDALPLPEWSVTESQEDGGRVRETWTTADGLSDVWATFHPHNPEYQTEREWQQAQESHREERLRTLMGSWRDKQMAQRGFGGYAPDTTDLERRLKTHRKKMAKLVKTEAERDLETEGKAVRRVRTREGAELYDQPIGTIIKPDLTPNGARGVVEALTEATERAARSRDRDREQTLDALPDIPEADPDDEAPDPNAPREVTFDVDRLEKFEKEVDRLNKVARRIKVPEITVTEIGRGTRTKLREDWNELYDDAADSTVEVETVTVAIQGQSPRLPGGWTYLGTIEYLRGGPGEDNGRLVHGDDPRLAPFRDADPDCEYCHLPRDRKKVMVLIDEEGKISRVGSTCLKDFLGYHGNPERVTEYADNIDKAVRDLEDDDSGFYRAAPSDIPTETFMELSAAVVREFGWVPKSSATGMPTAERVSTILFGTGSREMKEEMRKVKITEADKEKAKVVREWVAQQDYSNNYLGNLRTVLGGPWVGANRVGLAASAIGAWERATGIEAERRIRQDAQRAEREAAKERSSWVGDIGKRQPFTATVTAKIPYESAYGTGYVIKLLDADGNVLKTFTSGNWVYQTSVGDRITFKATPKSHDTWQEAKETNITRVGNVAWHRAPGTDLEIPRMEDVLTVEQEQQILAKHEAVSLSFEDLEPGAEGEPDMLVVVALDKDGRRIQAGKLKRDGDGWRFAALGAGKVLLPVAEEKTAEWGIEWGLEEDIEEEKALRRVRTIEGVRRYGQPIGSPITPDLPDLVPGDLPRVDAPAKPGASARPPVSSPELSSPLTAAFRKKYDAARAKLPDHSADWFDEGGIKYAAPKGVQEGDNIQMAIAQWRHASGSPGPKSLAVEAQIRTIGKVVDTEVQRRLKVAGIARPLTEDQQKKLRAKRDPILAEWTSRKWDLMDEYAGKLYGKPWRQMAEESGTFADWAVLNDAIIAEIHKDHPDLAELRRKSDELLEQLIGGDRDTYALAYADALGSVLGQLRPMGGTFDAKADINVPLEAPVDVAAGPNSGTIPYQWRHQGPWDSRAARAVNIDRRAMRDYNRLDQQKQKRVREAIRALEQGDAIVEPKTRALAGTYGVRLGKESRLLVYPHVDGSWHIYAVLPTHDYREAQRRVAGPADEPTPTFEHGSRVRLPNLDGPLADGRQMNPADRYFRPAVVGGKVPPSWDTAVFGDRAVLYQVQGQAERLAEPISGGVVQSWALPAGSRVFSPDLKPDAYSPERLQAIAAAAEEAGFDAVDFRAAGTVVLKKDLAVRTDTLDEEARDAANAEAEANIVNAARRFPSAWVDRSNSVGPFSIQLSDEGRGFYRDKGDPLPVLALSNDLSEERVAVHELSHRMEHVNPVLTAAEWVFLHRRTSRMETVRSTDSPEAEAAEAEIRRIRHQLWDAKMELRMAERGHRDTEPLEKLVADLKAEHRNASRKLTSLQSSYQYLSMREWPVKLVDVFPEGKYKEWERVRPDKFLTMYIGKDYGDGPTDSYEVLSMGMEGIWTGSQPMHKDDEHRQLVVGLLVAA